jgi:hypothetical protein
MTVVGLALLLLLVGWAVCDGARGSSSWSDWWRGLR